MSEYSGKAVSDWHGSFPHFDVFPARKLQLLKKILLPKFCTITRAPEIFISKKYTYIYIILRIQVYDIGVAARWRYEEQSIITHLQAHVDISYCTSYTCHVVHAISKKYSFYTYSPPRLRQRINTVNLDMRVQIISSISLSIFDDTTRTKFKDNEQINMLDIIGANYKHLLHSFAKANDSSILLIDDALSLTSDSHMLTPSCEGRI